MSQADAHAASMLQLRLGEPVIVAERTAYDAGAGPSKRAWHWAAPTAFAITRRRPNRHEHPAHDRRAFPRL
ncbi:hypothetical protein ACFQU7_43420 [Pseudoroseomonas wenyumeiae]